jgi:hypothetical protein
VETTRQRPERINRFVFFQIRLSVYEYGLTRGPGWSEDVENGKNQVEEELQWQISE